MSDEWEQMQDDEERAWLADMSDDDNDRTRCLKHKTKKTEQKTNEQTSEPNGL